MPPMPRPPFPFRRPPLLPAAVPALAVSAALLVAAPAVVAAALLVAAPVVVAAPARAQQPYPAGPAGRPAPALEPRGGPPGSEVTLTADGLAPMASVLVGFGGLGAGYEMVGEGRTDADGALSVSVAVPEWAEASRSHFFFVAYGHERPTAVSEPFLVTGPGGEVRLTGTVGSGSEGCVVLRGDGDTRYALVDETGSLTAGTAATVEGTVADGEPCGRELTIRVRRVVEG